MTKHWKVLIGGAVLAQIGLVSPNVHAFIENRDSRILENKSATVAQRASETDDTIHRVRSVNSLVQGASDSAGFSQRVLDTALVLLGRSNDSTKYKLTQQVSVFSKQVLPQEYMTFSQMSEDYYPLEGMGIRVMLQRDLKGLSVRLIDFTFSQGPASDSSMKAKSLVASVSATEAVQSVLGDVSAPVFRDQVLYRRINGQWKLVRDVQFEGLSSAAVIDVDSGTAWKEDRAHFAETAGGDVVGMGVLAGANRPDTKLVDLPMPHVKLDLGGATPTFTDLQGKFTIDSEQRASTLKSQLEGKFVKVSTRTGTDLHLEATVNPEQPGHFEFPVDAKNEITTAQTTAFYHVNQVHAWLNAHGLNSPGFDKMTSAQVNLDDTCNAYYTGGAVHFFKSGGDSRRQCVNSAYDSVVYHEYGHLVDDSYGGMTNGGLSEGWGDILSMYILGIPEVGNKFFLKGRDEKNYIRTGENTYQFPQSGYDEVHKLGQSWMGFAWKLRVALMAKYGQEKGKAKAEDLILPSLPSNATDIPAAVRETLARDTVGGTAEDLAEITAAAKAHNLDQFLKAAL